jgi:hypothetical protein
MRKQNINSSNDLSLMESSNEKENIEGVNGVSFSSSSKVMIGI